ncbi:MAG: hypothetical protein JW749_08145 [Sedimentisphaerales bacterium]|nr:hypothetical protein [Sedimentisphaerales bacterium]
MGKGVKNFFKIPIFGFGYLRVFAQQLFYTNVLNNCFSPEFNSLSGIGLRQKSVLETIKNAFFSIQPQSPPQAEKFFSHKAAVFEIKCFFRFFRDAIRSDSES